ncbi:unnamed protein product [Calicophoron daubneyi]|uniref:Uncharacterized protein n=1 Tax=Calicophoron daubneyi TaxID=300641 RepID=A0AAV2TVI4_CALDB
MAVSKVDSQYMHHRGLCIGREKRFCPAHVLGRLEVNRRNCADVDISQECGDSYIANSCYCVARPLNSPGAHNTTDSSEFSIEDEPEYEEAQLQTKQSDTNGSNIQEMLLDSVLASGSGEKASCTRDSLAPGTEIFYLSRFPPMENLVCQRQLAPCEEPSDESSRLSSSNAPQVLFLLSNMFELQLYSGDVEPVFGSAFLYDVHSRLRLSEVFHFDTNSDALMNFFSGSKSPQQMDYRELTTMTRSCLFRISPKRTVVNNSAKEDSRIVSPASNLANTHCVNSDNDSSSDTQTLSSAMEYTPESVVRGLSASTSKQFTTPTKDACCQGGVFLVIRVEKVLQQGDVSDILDMYGKDEKSKERLRATVSWCCQRLGRYRMPIAWTAIDLSAILLLMRGKAAALNSGSLPKSHAPLHNCRSREPSPHRTRIERRSHSIGPSQRCTNPNSIGNGYVNGRGSRPPSFSEAPEQATGENTHYFLPSSWSLRSDGAPINGYSGGTGGYLSMTTCTELNVSTFYKQELDKMSDDELYRCLMEIHRQTVVNPSFINLAVQISNYTKFTDPSSPPDFHSNPVWSPTCLAALLSPNSAPLKRLKTFPNLNMRIQLHCANSADLLTLLRSTGLSINSSWSTVAEKSTELRSRPLLSPESLPYSDAIFHPFPREPSGGQSMVHVNSAHRVSVTSAAKEFIEEKPGVIHIRPIREILELPSIYSMTPYMSYRNLLYVYPKSVSFPASRQASSRNIGVCVQLLYSDSTVTKVLPAIYGKSNSPAFVSEAFTTVLYHNRTPDLCDEIKIQLPGRLDEGHYLLFTFYHVSCQSKKVESSASLETVIGYSWLPILQQGSLCDANTTLLVSTMKPSPALAKLRPDLKEMTEKFYMDAFKWVDTHRELFHVTTTVVSSLYPQDAHVEFLLAQFGRSKVCTTLQGLRTRELITQISRCIEVASLNQLVSFLAPLLDGTLRLLYVSVVQNSACLPSAGPSSAPFLALHLLTQLVHRFTVSFPEWNDPHGRSRLLINYLAGTKAVSGEHVLMHHFSGEPLFGIPNPSELIGDALEIDMHERCLPQEIIRCCFPRGEKTMERIDLIFGDAWWFVLELLIRLMADHHLSHCRPHTGDRLTDCSFNFDAGFLEDLSYFISQIVRHLLSSVTRCTQGLTRPDAVAQLLRMNRSLGFFLFDLLSLMPSDFVLHELWSYWRTITERIRLLVSKCSLKPDNPELETLMMFKLDALQIFCSHRLFLALSRCVLPDFQPLDSGLGMVDGFVKWIPKEFTCPIVRFESSLNQPDCTKSWDDEMSGILNIPIKLVISELQTCLNLDSRKLQLNAVSLLWTMLTAHETDERLTGNPQNRRSPPPQVSSRPKSPWPVTDGLADVVALYLPLLSIFSGLTNKMVDSWYSLFPEYAGRQSSRPRNLQQAASVDDGLEKGSLVSGESGLIKRYSRRKRGGRREKTLSPGAPLPSPFNKSLIASGEQVINFGESQDSTKANNTSDDRFYDVTTLKRLLLCCLWIMRHTRISVFQQWICTAPPEIRKDLLILLYITSSLFEYQDATNKTKIHVQPSCVNGTEKRLYSSARSYPPRPNSSAPTHLFASLRVYAGEGRGQTSQDQTDLSTNSEFPTSPVKEEEPHGAPNSLRSGSARFVRTRARSSSCTPETRASEQQLVCTDSFKITPWMANRVALSIAEILDRITWGLWEFDASRGQTGLSLFTKIRSPLNDIVPYRGQHGYVTTGSSLLDTLWRIELYALGLNQSTEAHCRLLVSLRNLVRKFSSVISEQGDLLAAFSYHLLALCASSRPQIRMNAVGTLYFLIWNYYVQNKNLACIKTNLYLAFGALFASYDFREAFDRSMTRRSSWSSGLQGILKKMPLSQLEAQITDSLRLLNAYAERDRNYFEDGIDTALTPLCTRNTSANAIFSKAAHLDNPVFRAIDDDLPATFPTQVVQLAENLTRLFRDAVRLQTRLDQLALPPKSRIKPCLEDSFSVIDILHSIANRSRSSPELRLYWLMQITEKHYELAQFSEAAQCLSHCTATVAEHLVNRGEVPAGFSSTGCSDIAEAVDNINLLDESCVCGPSCPSFSGIPCPSPLLLTDLSPSISSLDMSWHFTPAGLSALLTWTAEAFAKAGLHEIVPRVYARLLPVLEQTSDYTRLADVHGRIKEAYNTLHKLQKGRRMFSTYFRVGFYGRLFEDLNSCEYVYKEAPFSKLAEVTNRILAYYEQKHGEGCVEVIKDSNPVELHSLDPEKAYLQVIYVEPYFEEFELRKRTTEFQRNYAIKRFVHSTPFTASGSAHGPISEQFQRKSILTTTRCFPYIKSRLLITSTEYHILSPIEVALEDVSNRVKQLEFALSKKPDDVKYLQMVLQGCIGTTVNQGPVEVASTFLQSRSTNNTKILQSTLVSDEASYMDAQNRLRICLQHLLHKSHQALCLNRQLIGSDQIEYHRELERNFSRCKRLLTPMLQFDRPSSVNGVQLTKENGHLSNGKCQ